MVNWDLLLPHVTSEEALRRDAAARAREEAHARGALSRPLEALTTRLRRIGL